MAGIVSFLRYDQDLLRFLFCLVAPALAKAQRARIIRPLCVIRHGVYVLFKNVD